LAGIQGSLLKDGILHNPYTIYEGLVKGTSPSFSDDGSFCALLLTTEDETRTITLFDTKRNTFKILCSGKNLGKPVFTDIGTLLFSDGAVLTSIDFDGNLVFRKDIHTAFTIATKGKYVYYCDEEDLLYSVNIENGNHVQYTGSSMRLFNPVISPCKKYLMAEELGGGILIISLSESGGFVNTKRIEEGDNPRFTNNPDGVIYVITRDDGHIITESKLCFYPLGAKDNKCAKKLSVPDGRIVIKADKDSKDNLLVIYDDGGFDIIRFEVAE
jgi:hypothetical protein